MLAEGLATFGHSVRIYSLLGRKHDMIKGKPAGFAKISEKIVEFVQRPKILWLEAMISYKRNQAPFWATRALNNTITRLNSDALWANTIVFDFPFSYCEIAKSHQLKVLNSHNIEAKLFAGRKVQKNDIAAKVARQEIYAIDNVNLVCCSSTEELHFFSEIAPNQQFMQIPNCIDRKRFHDLSKHREIIRKSLALNESTRALLFPASRYGPNQDGFSFLANFAARNQSLLDDLDLTFIVTGSVTKNRINSGRLIATGPVPAIEPYFGAADWGINPIFQGSGTSIKVAEMIAAELPMLTTAIGARGFDLRDQEDAIFFARETFSETLKNLPVNPEKLRQFASRSAIKNMKYLDPEAAVSSLHEAIKNHSAQ